MDFLSKISILNLSEFNTVLNNNKYILNNFFLNIDNITFFQFTALFVPCDIYQLPLTITNK